MNTKTYTAYAITYGEQPCGCSSAHHRHVYDATGNNYKKFTDKSEAIAAAIALMKSTDADNWNVI